MLNSKALFVHFVVIITKFQRNADINRGNWINNTKRCPDIIINTDKDICMKSNNLCENRHKQKGVKFTPFILRLSFQLYS